MKKDTWVQSLACTCGHRDVCLLMHTYTHTLSLTLIHRRKLEKMNLFSSMHLYWQPQSLLLQLQWWKPVTTALEDWNVKWCQCLRFQPRKNYKEPDLNLLVTSLEMGLVSPGDIPQSTKGMFGLVFKVLEPDFSRKDYLFITYYDIYKYLFHGCHRPECSHCLIT